MLACRQTITRQCATKLITSFLCQRCAWELSIEAMAVPRVKLGSQGLEVPQQGLGCMGMSAFYGPPAPEQDMIDLIHHAVERGVTFLDTADVYGPFTNEVLVGKAIKGIRDKVQLATKFANYFDEQGKFNVRGDPEYVHAAFEASLKRLDVDCIDLYYQHRVDTKVPIEVTVGAMKELVKQGKVKYLGLSEACASDIRRAHAVHPITAVQLEWSLWARDAEEDIIPTCRELGIGIVSYSPLGRGFFAGFMPHEASEGDFRKVHERFSGENLEKNERLRQRVCEIAEKKQCSSNQLALAWVQHKGRDVVPIPGTTKRKNLDSNIDAVRVQLSAEEVAELEAAVPAEAVAGERISGASKHTTWRYAQSPPLSSWKGSS